jgi:omega-6 fatty acid desaturase (delta-12 desaturase)
MRSGKELIGDSKKFSSEYRWRSWGELLSTIILTLILFIAGFLEVIPLPFRIFSSIICGLLYVRLFVIYHDYQHRAILQNSAVAHWIMIFLGIYLLAPETIWKRSHEHHHNNNSKLTLSGIGSYPTVSKVRYLKLSKSERRLYLINRHPLTVMFGYLTLFIYWLNIKSYMESPKRHFDSLLALVLHVSVAASVMYFYGPVIFIFAWCFPFFLAFSLGAYLFYSQHNFPGAKFQENKEWAYDQAAINSTSRMVMNPVMHWFTGNIGYHHIHHLNSRIPFYRLKEANDSMPELRNVPTTSWNPIEIVRCLRLKLWDAERNKMITLKQAYQNS